MTFGLTFEKLLLIGVIAALLVGPTRIPVYAAALGRFVSKLRALAQTTTDRVRDELGPEFTDEDWRALDPRRYDPRSIMRAALQDDPDADAPPATITRSRAALGQGGRGADAPGDDAPSDAVPGDGNPPGGDGTPAGGDGTPVGSTAADRPLRT
ncbi:Sec-independent protein translocase TatB [Agromyces sp. MMS24-K17]|uniref:Sec-independent protein translocase TatB n=1 Tax=Agromyces sp. MMS24-K17 TaxID=3372850 RepID=UPI003754B5E9